MHLKETENIYNGELSKVDALKNRKSGAYKEEVQVKLRESRS